MCVVVVVFQIIKDVLYIDKIIYSSSLQTPGPCMICICSHLSALMELYGTPVPITHTSSSVFSISIMSYHRQPWRLGPSLAPLAAVLVESCTCSYYSTCPRELKYLLMFQICHGIPEPRRVAGK